MRFPLVRSAGDDRPVAWWEILCAPIAIPLILLSVAAAVVLSVPVALLYPERKFINSIDAHSAEGRELIGELKRRESETPFWKRLAIAPLRLLALVVLVPVITIYDALIGQWLTKK